MRDYSYCVYNETVQDYTLEQIIANKKVLDQRFVLKLFEPIMEAINHAHINGIALMNIRLSNILLDQDLQPKVFDLSHM